MKNSKKCKFTAGLDSIPLEKVHSASYRRKIRSIKSYISLNFAGSNIFWWNGKGIAYHYICWFFKIKPDCIYLSYLKRKFLSPTLLSEIVYLPYETHTLAELWITESNLLKKFTFRSLITHFWPTFKDSMQARYPQSKPFKNWLCCFMKSTVLQLENKR